MRKGAKRVHTFEVHHPDGSRDDVALYQSGKKITILIDTFSDDGWTTKVLKPDTTDILRRTLNKAYKERSYR